jgi:mediator of RNA polymerase II transcription subunit 6
VSNNNNTMAQDGTPLDERVYQEHMHNVWYMGQLENSQFHFPFMSDNMLHHYFANSPFFDWTTKNGLEIQQCQKDPYGWQFSHNRKDFEAQIASRSGQEYMIVEGEGMEFDKEGKPIKGGVWVIRKQERIKGAPPKGKDSVETLATYYVVGENVYQAPSVGDILGTRLLSASTALNKCFSQASTLPRWSPTTGHTYPTTSSTAANGKNPTTNGSIAGSTPSGSREGSVANDFRAGSSMPGGAAASSTASSSSALANRLLRDSLVQSFTYADDPFADENPLQGEPGSLAFASSTAAAKKRKADAEAAAKVKEEAIAAALTAAVEAASKPATPAAGSPTTPGKVAKKTKEKKKRRKSKHDAQSPPMSPLGGTPAATPGPNAG